VPSPPLAADIAAWGDSLTPPMAANLQLMVPGRKVFNGGVTGETSTQIAARLFADGGAHANWINIFWYGQNNQTDPERIKADLAASVAALSPGNRRFLILGVVNKARDDEQRGAPNYETIVRLNRELAALYPNNFIDIRSWLVNLAKAFIVQDLTDQSLDEVPSSLRFDEIHLNNDGSIAVAAKVKEWLDARGW
jgi:lysophospholipase L1-like esterase